VNASLIQILCLLCVCSAAVQKHPEFELTYDMMLGIRTVVGNNPIGHSLLTAPSASGTAASAAEVASAKKRVLSEAAAKRAKEEALMHQTLKLTFPGKGSSHTPAHAMRDFKFKDYSAEVFRNIRDRFKIDPTEYLLCVCGNFQYLEFISNSKSGQFFFYCQSRHTAGFARDPARSMHERTCAFCVARHCALTDRVVSLRVRVLPPGASSSRSSIHDQDDQWR
jgi:hypothetical protein